MTRSTTAPPSSGPTFDPVRGSAPVDDVGGVTSTALTVAVVLVATPAAVVDGFVVDVGAATEVPSTEVEVGAVVVEVGPVVVDVGPVVVDVGSVVVDVGPVVVDVGPVVVDVGSVVVDVGPVVVDVGSVVVDVGPVVVDVGSVVVDVGPVVVDVGPGTESSTSDPSWWSSRPGACSRQRGSPTLRP